MGRPSTQETQGYQLEALNGSHEEILRLDILGYKAKEIGDILGMHRASISRIQGAKLYKDRRAILAAARDSDSVDVSKSILRLAPQALEQMQHVLDHGVINDVGVKPELVIKVAESVLDRAGFQAIKKVENITNEEKDNMLQNALAAAKASGVLIEAEAVVITNPEESSDESNS